MAHKIEVKEVKLPNIVIAYRVYVDDRFAGTMGQSKNGIWHVSKKQGEVGFTDNILGQFMSRRTALGFILDETFFNVVTWEE